MSKVHDSNSKWTRGARAVGKGALGLLLFTVVAVALVIALINIPPGRGHVRQRLESAVQASAPGFELGELGGFLPFTISLENVRLADRFGTETIKVDRIFIDPVLWPLVQKRLVLDELRIESPFVRVQQTESGNLNVAELLEPSEQPKKKEEPSAWAARVEKLTLHDGKIVRPDANQAISELSLAARAHYHPGEEISGRLDQLTGHLSLDGTNLQLSARGEAQYDPARGEAGQIAADFRAELEEPDGSTRATAVLEASGTLPEPTGEFALRSPTGGSLVVSGSARTPNADELGSYEVTLRAEDLDPSGFLTQLPRANVTLRADLEGRDVPLEDTSRMAFDLTVDRSSVMGFAIESAHVRLSSAGDRWRLSSLEVRALGLSARAEGHGTKSRAEAELTVRSQERGDVPGPLAFAGALHASIVTPLPYGDSGDESVPFTAGAELDIERLGYRQLKLRDAHVELSARLESPFQGPLLGRGELDLTVDPFRLNDRRVEALRVSADSDGQKVEGSAALVLAARRKVPAMHAEFSAPLAPNERFGIDLAGLSAEMDWNRVPLGIVSAFVDTEQRIRGRFDAHAEIEGTADALKGSAQLRLMRARVGDGEPVSGRLTLTALPDSTSAALNARVGGRRALLADVEAAFGTELLLSGDTAALSEREFEADVRVPSLELATLAEASGSEASGSEEAPPPVSGRLEASLHARGTLDALDLEGRVKVANAQVSGTNLESIRLAFDGSSRAKSVARATLHVAGAQLMHARLSTPVTVGGLIERGGMPKQPSFELQSTVTEYPLRELATLNPSWGQTRGRLAGTLSARGTLSDPKARAELIGRDLVVDGKAAGDARLSLEVADKRAEGQAFLIQDDGGGLRMRASAEVPGELHAKVVFDALDVAFLSAYEQIEDPQLTAEIELDGELFHMKKGAADESGASAPGPLAAVLDLDVRNANLPLPLSPGGSAKSGSEQTAKASEQKQAKTWEIDDTLRSLLPLRVRRLAVKNARLRLVANSEPQRPTLVLRDLSLTIENLATREALFRGGPAVLGLRAGFERGELVAFATMDPLAERATLALEAELRGLALAAVSDYLDAKLGVETTHGQFSATASLRAIDGELKGAIRPKVVNPEFEPAHDTLKSWAKATLADLGEMVALDEIGGRDAETAVVPLEGTFTQPKPQFVPAVLSLLQDAVLVGLIEGAGNAWPWQLPVQSVSAGSAGSVAARDTISSLASRPQQAGAQR